MTDDIEKDLDFLFKAAKLRAKKAISKFPQPNYTLNKFAEETET